jgi:hypothetical protein
LPPPVFKAAQTLSLTGRYVTATHEMMSGCVRSCVTTQLDKCESPSRKGGVLPDPAYTKALPSTRKSPTRKGGVLSDPPTRKLFRTPGIPHPEGWDTFRSCLHELFPYTSKSPTRKGGVLSDPAYTSSSRTPANPPPGRVGYFQIRLHESSSVHQESPTRKAGVLSDPAYTSSSRTPGNTPPFRVGYSGKCRRLRCGPDPKIPHPSGWGIRKSGAPAL